MFGRPIDYDTANDAVVRVQATEVRKRLAQYYRQVRESPAVCIELPTGSYEPKFIWQQAAPIRAPSSPSKEPFKRQWIFVPAVAALILAIGIFGMYTWLKARQAKQGIHSIAVLPFHNPSGEPELDHLADGVTDWLISDLGQIHNLRVISATSSMTYKSSQKSLPQIARELDVQAVVEGSVTRDENRLRITAALIDPQADTRVWSQTYERDPTNLARVQGEVAQAISNQIWSILTSQPSKGLSDYRAAGPQAQTHYLEGLLLLTERGPGRNVYAAAGEFRQAIAADPNYAEAHAQLARAYGWLGMAGIMPYEQAFPWQKSEALRAIEINPQLAEAHVQLANSALNLDWNWEAAEREFLGAIALDPNSATAHRSYSTLLTYAGRFSEGIAEAETSFRLDPVSAPSFERLAEAYYSAHQYDKAFALIQKARALDGDPNELSFLMGMVSLQLGNYSQAIAEFKSHTGHLRGLAYTATAYGRSGDKEAARQAISQLESIVLNQDMGRYEIAMVYAGMEEKDQAIPWLEKAYAAHEYRIIYLKADPSMDSLRSDPRFQDLIRRVNFP